MLTKGTHGSYGALLFDERWKNKRTEIIERDYKKCRCCESNLNLQVHHRQYKFSYKLRRFKNPWDYPNDLLVTLCEKCHKKGHQLYKVPIKYTR